MTREYPDPGKAYQTIDELFQGVYQILKKRDISPNDITGITGECDVFPYDRQGNFMGLGKIVISTKKGGIITSDINYLTAFPGFENDGDRIKYEKWAEQKTAQVVGYVRMWLEELHLDGVKYSETKIPAFIGYNGGFVPLNQLLE